MKYIGYALVAAVISVVSIFAHAADLEVSSGEIVPGVWNSRFNAAKRYADENHIPMIVFYGKTDCSECAKLKKAIGTDEYIAWQDEKQYVQVLSMKYVASDWSDARAFIKSSPLNSDSLPMVAVYWNKPDGTVIRKAFVGRSSTMPSSVRGTLEVKFIDSIEGILGSGGDTPAPDPAKPTVPSFFNSAKTVALEATDGAGLFEGIVEVKVGRANTKTYTSKISATVQLLDFGSMRFSAKAFNVATTKTFVLTSSTGVLTLEFDGTGLTGTLERRSGVAFDLIGGVTFGGAMPTAKSKFLVFDLPHTYKGYDVFAEWLPAAPTGQEFSSGTRWSVPKKGSVRYNRSTGEFVNSGAGTNASGLKLTYTPKTGYFRGSFLAYYKSSATKAGKVTAKVVGYVVNGVGYGTATIPSLGTYDVQITAP